jgi:hypothetical protein
MSQRTAHRNQIPVPLKPIYVRLQVGGPQVPMIGLIGEKNSKQHVRTS